MGKVTLNDLIELAIRQKDWKNQTYNQSRLGREAQLYCRKLTNRFCAGMPEDLHDDICQTAFVKLFEYDADALTASSGQKLFRLSIFEAIRTTYAAYAAPGQRRRKSNVKPMRSRIAAEHVGRIVDAAELTRGTVNIAGVDHIDFDRFPSSTAAADIQSIEDQFDVEKYMRFASPLVARALHLICVDGERVADVARDAGVSRFVLNRKLMAFSSLCRAA